MLFCYLVCAFSKLSQWFRICILWLLRFLAISESLCSGNHFRGGCTSKSLSSKLERRVHFSRYRYQYSPFLQTWRQCKPEFSRRPWQERPNPILRFVMFKYGQAEGSCDRLLRVTPNSPGGRDVMASIYLRLITGMMTFPPPIKEMVPTGTRSLPTRRLTLH